jgi:uncharacterized SAM-binding protein YcdF (DUF218 family)
MRERLPGRHRLGRVALGCACLVIAALVVASYLLFVRPSTSGTGRGDAVVVLAGGRGERLTRARALMDRDVAPTLAISNGTCGARRRYRMICFRPDPQTTRGEAEAVRRLARANGWNRIVVVTSTYHVTRARILVHRCYAGHTVFVGATPPDGIAGWTKRIVHEWMGLVEALAVRGC